MLSYIHPKSVLLDNTTPFMTTIAIRLLSKKIWHLGETTYDCYFYPKHFLPSSGKIGMNTEQTTGRKRTKDVDNSAVKFTSESANEPVKRVVGYGGCHSDGHGRAGISILINNISTIGKCLVLPKRMKAGLAAILAPTRNRFILGACLVARLQRVASLLQQIHKVTDAKRAQDRRVHEALHL
jgi:hypothetical protein